MDALDKALVLSEGKLYLYSGKENAVSAVACTADLELRSVDLVQDSVVLLVSESGSLYRCDLSLDVVSPLDCPQVPGGARSAVATVAHTALVDEAGRLWSWGRPPQVGTVTECPVATRLRVSAATEVVQLVAGRDFTAALVRKRKGGAAVQVVPDTPDTPEGELEPGKPHTDGPVCPLGLALQPDSTLGVDIKPTDQTDSSCDVTSEAKLLALPGPVSNVMSQVSSQVSSLGRSVWTNSMSLLSISSQQESEAGAGSDSNSGSLSQSSSRSSSLKSRSEPPGLTGQERAGRGWRRSVSVAGGSRGEGEAGRWCSLREEGERRCSAELWTWGGGRRGQLGQGDMLVRNNPSLVRIPGLAGLSHLTRLSAGGHHLLALTDCGAVWGWGDNSRGQASYTEHLAVVLSPSQLALQPGELARDINCSGETSAVLTSLSRCYVLGCWRGERLSRLQVVDLGLSSQPSLLPASVWLSEAGLVVRCEAEDRTTRDLAVLEQKMLRTVSEVTAVLDKVLKPQILHSEQPEVERVRGCLARLYQVVTGAREGEGVRAHTGRVTQALSRLSRAVGDGIAADTLLLDNVSQSLTPTILTILTTNLDIQQTDIPGQAVLEQLLTVTTTRLLSPYLECLQAAGRDPTQEVTALTEVQARVRREVETARDTRQFWQSAGPRLAGLMTSKRRLILDSRKDAVTLEGRYTKHWLVLLSDCLIDAGYNTTTKYDLETVWLELSNTDSKFQISVKTPEDQLTLSFPDVTARAVWAQALSKCIITTLQSDTERSDPAPVSVPVSRWAKYCWKRGELKGCEYHGSWLQGKMHGRGTMSYTDKSQHEGLWRDGKRHGKGVLSGPAGKLMDGTWIRDCLRGRGKLVDGHGNVYTGDIVDGQPHGHGIMKEGRFMDSGANIYIGSWVRGVKQGYGVMDDIMTGEKYLGMWEQGSKHGPGCVVNSDSVYYEGTFYNNKLLGPGLMLFEDGARYEGEFSGAGEFNGRGTLYSGNRKHVGNFHGNYSDCMKFSGEIKTVLPEEVTARDTGTLIEPGEKWKDVFTEWDQSFNTSGEPANTAGNTRKLWENIAIFISNAKTANPEEPLPDSLETIPACSQVSTLTYQDFLEVENYLTEAFQASLHPLHLIFTQLVEAFISSYGGVRSHSTLLPHAKGELCSIISRLYTILSSLFPALPEPTPDSASPLCLLSPSEEEGRFVTPTSILHPVLLPKLHPTIFMLYALRYFSKLELLSNLLKTNILQRGEV